MGWSEVIKPMKAVLDGLPPDDDTWLAELKWDGMRLLVHVGEDRLIMRSGSGRTVTDCFPELGGLVGAIAPGSVLDGEAIVMTEGGPSFRALQHRIHVENPSASQLENYPVNFVAFDLLYFAENDIRPLPLTARRDALTESFQPGGRWSMSPGSDDPAALFAVATERNLEGIVCKKLDSPYLGGGRSQRWRKVKIRPRTDMVVGGWLPGSGSLANTIGSLAVGVYDDGDFLCAGLVGSGLTDLDRRRLLKLLRPQPESPFGNPELIAGRAAELIQWVEPLVVVEIGFGRWEPGEAIWHPTFHGVRFDTDPADTEYRI